MATDIFGGNGSITALYGLENTSSTVTFSNIGEDSFKYGFLVESYQLTWGRQVITKRVFNLDGRVAITGAGQGTLTLTGMVGAADEFEKLIGATTGADICDKVTCTIEANSGFATCSSDGSTQKHKGAVEITCKGVLLASIGMGGQISDANALISQGTLTFNITGLDIRADGGGGGSSGGGGASKWYFSSGSAYPFL